MDAATARALQSLAWTSALRYHDASAQDPRGRLAPGTLDDHGASRVGHAQTTYHGWVTDLQDDLARLGFDPGPVEGVFGPTTERAVRLFQEAALTCPHRDGGVTFAGRIDGVVDDATRAEITLWWARDHRRHVLPLSATGEDRIVERVATALYGAKAHGRVHHDPERGLVYGLLDFDQAGGALGGLVWRLWCASPATFRRVFGPDGEREALVRLTDPDAAVRRSLDLAADAWTRRFAAAGEVGFWRREQLAVARAWRLAPVLAMARAAGLRRERAVAALLLLRTVAGDEAARAAARALGPRPPGVPIARHLAPLPDFLARLAPSAASAVPALRELLAATDFEDCALLDY
jgi:hypothetical protein